MTTKHPRVQDWAVDFDHSDPRWVADPYLIWDDLRTRCPVAHSERYGGTWLPVRHADVAAVAYDTEHFTSRSVVVSEVRLVARDFEFEGCPMMEGDWPLLPFPAANRDPEVFPDAGQVQLDRADNRHAAFGLGIHRCIGSNLARMELRVAIEEWMRCYPDFELADPSEVTWSAGQVRGPRSIPVRVLEPVGSPRSETRKGEP